MPIHQGIAFLVLAILGVGVGATLAIYSSVRASKIRDYVIEHELAPKLTRTHYLRAFDFAGVCNVYQKATEDRSSVWITYSTGLLGVTLFIGSLVLVVFSDALPL